MKLKKINLFLFNEIGFWGVMPSAGEGSCSSEKRGDKYAPFSIGCTASACYPSPPPFLIIIFGFPLFFWARKSLVAAVLANYEKWAVSKEELPSRRDDHTPPTQS